MRVGDTSSSRGGEGDGLKEKTSAERWLGSLLTVSEI
jgi:hypothetical protein